MTRLGGALELPAANIRPKATGEDMEVQGMVATNRFPSRVYAVFVHVSRPQGGQHVHRREPYLHGCAGVTEERKVCVLACVTC